MTKATLDTAPVTAHWVAVTGVDGRPHIEMRWSFGTSDDETELSEVKRAA